MFRRVFLAIAALIAIVAVLQYRWISQVSSAELTRQRGALEVAAARFSQEFNGELVRAFLSMQLGRAEGGPEVEESAERVVGWMSSTPYRRMVRGFYRARGGDNGLAELLHYDPSVERFEPSAWPAHLAELRARLEERERRGFRGVADMAAWVDEDVPAVVGARPQGPPFADRVPVGGWSILDLDLEYIRRELLPHLASKHFSSDYEVRVVSRTDPEREVFGGPDPGSADAVGGLLDFRVEPGVGAPGGPSGRGAFGIPGARPFFRRGPQPPGGREAQRPMPGVGNPQGPPPGVGNGQRPMRGAGNPQGPPPGVGGAPEPLDARPPVVRPLAPMQERGRWKLLVRHRAGSLEAAIARNRLRDLSVSGLLLVLLAAASALLVESTRRAQRLAHQQMEFVAGVSHELRTPLTVISSAADNLADGVVAGHSQVKRYGSVIRQESRRLTEMIEQLLRFSGLQSGRARYKLQPVVVETVIDRALAACQSELEESGMELQKDVRDGLPAAQADSGALIHCLSNLISNALKHAREGRWIGVSARAVENGATTVEFLVEDRGPGIDAADLAHIWEPFYRGRQAVSDQIKGAGLGLSLVKRMTEAQGGTVEVSSRPGEGAVFRLRFPAARGEL
jgi:signal transduction histidine kinase